jgi:predicted Abi (CAAX) family protease
MFVVQSLAPRALFKLEPDEVILDKKESLHYAKKGVWKDASSQRGKIMSVLLSPDSQNADDAVAQWQEGDEALLVSVYGGVGGKRREPNASIGGIYFGHFAYGTARVSHEPLANELRFDIVYHQVFTNNLYGLVPGNLHWTRYMGDRQWGFLGLRPVADILLRLNCFTDDYKVYDRQYSVLDMLAWTLESMMVRYRIGDGTGGTYMTAANNCAQDSNQALYATIKNFDRGFKSRPQIQQWLQDFPEQTQRVEDLLKLGEALRGKLLPFRSARADWSYQIENLGSNLSESHVSNLLRGLASWRTLLPCVAFKTISQVFLEHGATAWVLRTNQCGGDEPDIEPLAPFPC